MRGLPERAAIIVLGRSALPLAERLKASLPRAAIHAPTSMKGDADHSFSGIAAHLRDLFAAGTPIIGLCASGILIRALAPLVSDKRSEPPVVAVAEDGSVAIPLLGGHRGANALARAIAATAGGTPAISTAGDLRFDLALDEPPPGWRIANPDRARPVMAALLSGEPVALKIEAGDAQWLTASGVPFSDEGSVMIRVTDRAVAADEEALAFHPPILALGVGCERGAGGDALMALVDETLCAHGLAREAVALVASIDVKSDEAAIHEVAAALGVPARFFSAAALLAETPRLQTRSEIVFRAVGCYGVAEGAALAAAGAEATLIAPKQARERGTCAVARAPRALDANKVGQPRGKLTIIGIGPGDDASRTKAADEALRQASDIVGYRLYLDLIAPAIAGKRRHDGTLGAEEERVRLALDLAASGRNVALVSSGDAGIYGLASLVFELVDREARGDWRRIEVAVVPGVSAMQAAAARLGAPLGHDFCAISLSDLLTPWADIERRVAAAAASDFVIALYNPRSLRRTAQLARAREILLAARPGDTPVALARNLGRLDESVAITRLAALDPDAIDMLTIVIIGSSTTRQLGARPLLYTPRGYAAKRNR